MSTFGTPPMRIVTDTATTITGIDGALATIIGLDTADLEGSPLSRIVAPEAVERLGADLVDIVDGTRTVATAPRRLRADDGHIIDAVVSVQRRESEGHLAGFDLAVLLGDDQTDLSPTLPEHLRRLPTPAALVDGEGQIIDTNLSWGTLFGLSAAIAPGGDLFALLQPEGRSALRSTLADLRRTGEAGRTLEVRARSDHGDFWARLAVTQLGGSGGHATVTAEDVSRQHVENRILLSNEALFRSLAEASPVAIARITTERRLTYANPAWHRLLTATNAAHLAPEAPEPDQRRLDDVLAPDDDVVGTEIDVRVATRSSDPVRIRLNESTWVNLRLSPVLDDEIGVVGHVATLEDISALVADLDPQRALDLAAAGDLIGIADLETGQVRYLNDPARVLFAGEEDAPLELAIADLYTEDAQDQYRAAIESVLRAGETWSGELTMRRHDGAEVRVLQTIAAELGDDRAPRRLSVMGRVVSDGDTTIEELVHRATHDHLTGLPNRGLLLDRLELALARARRESTPVALLFIDLDRFKEVNDTHGHDAGDAVLVQIAERMSEVLRPSDTVARLGGDEFVVLCEDLTGDLDAATIAERLLDAIETTTVAVADTALTVSASIGIAVSTGGPHGPDGPALLQRSDVAMYRAKKAGRSRIEIFDEVMRDRRQRRVELVEQLQSAIEDETLDVLYQPIVDLRTGRIAAVEALVRWLHPTRGLIGPDEFLPLAVQTHLDVSLDHQVMRRALNDASRWAGDCDTMAPPVHVNTCARTLASSTLATEIIESCLTDERSASDLVIEVAEGLLAHDGEVVADRVAELVAAGIRCAVDDVGSESTALRHLASAGFAFIKVDSATLREITVAADQPTTLLGATVAFGRSLGLRVVVTGVETPEMVLEAIDLGADMAQGRALADASSAEVIARLLPLRHQLVPLR
jgi:diguanylate cyclase (GGDEF)-like protein/PAS domain S-box-containing protein